MKCKSSYRYAYHVYQSYKSVSHTHTQHMHTHTCAWHAHAYRSIKVAFSLTMDHNNIEFINEGILLSANSLNFSTENIHFYYPTCESDQNISPNVEPSLVCDDHDVLMHNLTLTYDDNLSFRVNGTFNRQLEQQHYTVDSVSQLVNRIVSLKWEQRASCTSTSDCDVWSLDNVKVILQYENCTKAVLSEDFEGMK